jgi:hypothetical protein
MAGLESFHEAIRSGDLVAVQRGVAGTPSVLHSCAAAEERCALHVAAETGHLQILRFLLQQDADFAAVTVAGEVPLMLAARRVGAGLTRGPQQVARSPNVAAAGLAR